MDFGEILQIAFMVQGTLAQARNIDVGSSKTVLAPDFNIDGDPDGPRIKYKSDVYEVEGIIVKKVK